MHSYKSKRFCFWSEKKRGYIGINHKYPIVCYGLTNKTFPLYIIDDFSFSFLTVNFDHFQILRAIGKGSFGKVSMHDYI